MSSEYSRFKYSVKRALIRDFNWERDVATRWLDRHNTVLRILKEEGHTVGKIAQAIVDTVNTTKKVRDCVK